MASAILISDSSATNGRFTRDLLEERNGDRFSPMAVGGRLAQNVPLLRFHLAAILPGEIIFHAVLGGGLR